MPRDYDKENEKSRKVVVESQAERRVIISCIVSALDRNYTLKELRSIKLRLED